MQPEIRRSNCFPTGVRVWFDSSEVLDTNTKNILVLSGTIERSIGKIIEE
jgi:hypothetical protein